ncbi:MAG TPA: phosphoribosyltransferase family protein [Nitrososphaerales archaeon]|nr:phosphoribosyltransferase family protein [Nitrososphaerales archaeon]HUK75479.1 phosphoribosyltransferase family protein [Nitrososphaerales archaeon]
MNGAIYRDREEAGKALASALKRELVAEAARSRPLVLAIPRGGVPLGKLVAEALNADLDIVVPRKIGAEFQPEFALGAVMDDGTLYLNEESMGIASPSKKYLEGEMARQVAESKRRLKVYRGARPQPKISGRVVIVVDDGVATGATMKAALRWARARGPRLLVAAAPVAPASTISELRKEADLVVCPNTPEPFYAVGAFYTRFDQVEDEEVEKTLEEFWARSDKAP